MMRHILFLKTAHCCDEQNEKIDRELLAIAAKETTIVRELRGVSGQAHTSAAPGYTRDPGEMMAGRRIHAWSACMAACGELNMPGKTPVFVTTSRSVFDYLDNLRKNKISGTPTYLYGTNAMAKKRNMEQLAKLKTKQVATLKI